MNLELHPRNIVLSLVALALISMAVSSFASQKFDATLAGAMTRAGIEKVADGSYKRMRLSAKVEVVKILVRRVTGAAGSPPAGYSCGGECTVQTSNSGHTTSNFCFNPSGVFMGMKHSL